MRKGYWKTLLRRLRSRLASGLDTFTFRQLSLTLTEVLASDGDSLENPDELPLAATSGSAMLSIDAANNLVLFRADDGAPGESTGLDLSSFIDALVAGTPKSVALELSLGEVELVEPPMPCRD